jgi:hypothetical protein
MEPHRTLAIASLKVLIADRENEKRRLTALIAFTQSPERRAQALGDLKTVRDALKVETALLEKLESDSTG